MSEPRLVRFSTDPREAPKPEPPWTCSCGQQFPTLMDLSLHAHEFGGLLHGDSSGDSSAGGRTQTDVDDHSSGGQA